MKSLENSTLIISIRYISILILFTSCNNKSDSVQYPIKQKPVNISYTIDLPNSIKVSDTLNGLVLYKSDYIDLNKIERRYVNLYLTKKIGQLENDYEIKEHQTDTFTLIYDSIIPVYDIKFNKKGLKRLEGTIEEELYIMDTMSNKLIKKSIETKINHLIKVE